MQTTNFASYYESLKIHGDQFAIVEALQALNSQIDFSQYDANNDGNENFFVRILKADKNNSLSKDGSISQTDLLTSKTFDLSGLSGYSWHQGGQIAVSISVASMITNNAANVTLNITVS